MTASTPLRSTRLENLRLEGDRAWLDLEGQPIEIAGEAAAPALQSFQTFYQTAFQAYQAQPDRAPTASRPPWWQRLRGWFTQWIGGMRSAAGRLMGPDNSAAGAASPAPAAAASPASVPSPSVAASRSAAPSPMAAPSALRATRSTPASAATSPQAIASSPQAAPASRLSPAAVSSLALRPDASQPEPDPATPNVPTLFRRSRTEAQPAQATHTAQEGSSHRSPAAAAALSPVPLLRAAFADEKGVHLVWKNPSGRGAQAETEMIYPFDSPVAAGLQACYGQLAEMGHTVVDLAPWQPGAEGVVERDLRARLDLQPRSGPSAVRGQARPEAALAGSAAVGFQPVAPSGQSASASERPFEALAKDPGRASPAPASARTDTGRLMRLNPERSDIASRLVVIPAEGDPKPEVITGAETFFNALHAAAESAVPEPERLTFLRCRQVKGELKVVELGFGRQNDDAAEPARTESATAWWKNAQKIRAAEAKAPDSAAPSVLPALRNPGEGGDPAGPSAEPDPAHQAELFGG